MLLLFLFLELLRLVGGFVGGLVGGLLSGLVREMEVAGGLVEENEVVSCESVVLGCLGRRCGGYRCVVVFGSLIAKLDS